MELFLIKLKKLRMLQVSGTKITNASLKELAKMQSLIALSLSDTKVTRDGVAELKKALPNCTIYPR